MLRRHAWTGSRGAPAFCRWSTPSSVSSTSRRSTRRTSTASRRSAATPCAPARTCSTRASRRARARASSTRCTGAASTARNRTSATRRAASCASWGGPPAARWRSCCTTSTPALTFTHETDVLVLGTGYRDAPVPLPALAELAVLDGHGRPVVEADYRVRLREGVGGGDRTAVRPERRAALPRRRRARPRARRASQRGHRQRALRARGLPGARAQRVSVLRAAARGAAAAADAGRSGVWAA